MKKSRYVLILATIFAFFVVDADAQRKNKKKMDSNPKVAESIKDKNFTLEAQTAFPNGGKSVSLTSRYSVEVKQDSVFSHLPYYGRAYSLPYGGGEGLVFDGKITDYKSSKGKKDATIIEFEVRTREDFYKYIITIFPNGGSSIKVIPNNKQSIDFSARMIFPDEEAEDNEKPKKKRE